MRLSSYLIPTRALFSAALSLRGYHAKWSDSGAPDILLRLIDHVFCNLRPTIVEAQVHGLRFFVLLNDPNHYSVLLGLHEHEVVECVQNLLAPGMTMLDVGANAGYFSLLAALAVGERGRVIAVEPDPRVLEVLTRNLGGVEHRNTTVVNAAAFDSCDSVSLGCAPATSWSSIYYGKPTRTITVPAVTLDALSEQLGLERVDFVKIDVEGAEQAVLRGMSGLLQHKRPAVLVELHGEVVEPGQHPAACLLRQAGYSVQKITQRHVLGRPTA